MHFNVEKRCRQCCISCWSVNRRQANDACMMEMLAPERGQIKSKIKFRSNGNVFNQNVMIEQVGQLCKNLPKAPFCLLSVISSVGVYRENDGQEAKYQK